MAIPTQSASEAPEDAQDKLHVECEVCHKLYTNPKLLSCFHAFCAQCIKELSEFHDGSTVTCPECHQPTPLLQSGVDGLQSAFYLHRLISIQETLEKVKEPQKAHCENSKCKKATVASFCHDCGKFTCEVCTAAHYVLDELASHQVVSIGDIQADISTLLPPTRQVMYCSKHSDNVLKIYCETCQELICNDCTIRFHKEHQYDLVTDMFPKYRDEVLEHVTTVRNLANTVTKAVKELDEQKNEIGEQRKKIEADIHGQIDQLHQALNQRRAELVGQLNQLTQQKLRNLTAQREQIELLQTQLSSCLEYVEGSLKTGTEEEILTMKAPVISLVERMTPKINSGCLHPQERPDMLMVHIDVPTVTSHCHKLAAITTIASQSYSTGDGLKLAVFGEDTEITLHVPDNIYSRGSSVETADITSKLLCSHDSTETKGKIEKLHGNIYLIRYQPVTRGKHHLHITIGGRQTRGSPHTVVVRPNIPMLVTPVKVIGKLRGPWGMTSNSKGMLIITENKANRVSMLNSEGERVYSFGSEGSKNGQFHYPCGVTVDSEDNIYVVDNKNHRVQKFTPSGEHIASTVSEEVSKLQFENPVGIGFNRSNNKLYVCDNVKHRVQILDTDLLFQKKFGGKGNGNGQFNHLWDVSFDSDGNVYIADGWNNRVQVFTPEGEYLRKFGSKGNGRGQLLHPSGIAVDRDTVYVTEEGNHRVSVFTTRGEFKHSFSIKGQNPGQMRYPEGITVDNSGFILVSDSDNNRIQVY